MESKQRMLKEGKKVWRSGDLIFLKWGDVLSYMKKLGLREEKKGCHLWLGKKVYVFTSIPSMASSHSPTLKFAFEMEVWNG